MNDMNLPTQMPLAFEPDLKRYNFSSGDLWDPADPIPGHLAEPIRTYADRQIEAIRRLIFPVFRL